jgi:signal recognition particle receptor subunit beta
MEANQESLLNLEKNLKEQGYDLKNVPYVLQMNKRDLPTAIAAEEMYRQLNLKGEPTFEAVAMNGTGVFDTLKAVAKLVLTELKKK